MPARSTWGRRGWRRALLALLLAPIAAAAAPGPESPGQIVAAENARSVLALVVDGRPQDEPVAVDRVGDEISLRAADLRQAGVAVPPGGTTVSLAAIPGLRYTIDEARQLLDIRTGQPLAVRAGGAAGGAPVEPLMPNGWGGFVNYDATVYASRHAVVGSAAVTGTVFTPRGYAYAGAIISGAGGPVARVDRTDIGYTFASSERMLRASVGDYINGASSVSRPVRMAGVRIGTDFSVRPDLVTFPLPNIGGTAAVASSIDLIVNGSRQPIGDVGAGQFSIADVPVQTGLNTVTVATRDALGHATTQTITTYASRDLLRPGLSAFSLEAGWVRTGYLTNRDRYRDLAGSGTWRRGLSDRLTLEAHAEASRDVALGSVGGLVNLDWLGVASGSLAISRPPPGRAGVGTEWTVGLQRVARPVSVAVRYLHHNPSWSDLAARYGSTTLKRSLIATVGFDLARYGTVGVGVLALGPGQATADRYRLPAAYRTATSTLVNATYSVRLTQRIGLIANAGTDTRRRRSAFASIGATVVFDARSSGYAGASRSSGGTSAGATVDRSALVPGDWGYHADVAVGPVDHATAAIRHLGRAGMVEAAVETVGGETAGRLSARGSIVHVGGHSFAADTMSDSFAVVDTGGQPGVTIYRDHHPVGTTDRHGLLVVPNLAAFQPTLFSIDPAALDASLTFDRSEVPTRPGEHVGVRVPFAIAREQAVLFTLVDAAGRPLPTGARGRYRGSDVDIGFDGQAWFTPGDGGALTVELPAGRRCVATVPARRAIAGRVDRLACLVRAPP